MRKKQMIFFSNFKKIYLFRWLNYRFLKRNLILSRINIIYQIIKTFLIINLVLNNFFSCFFFSKRNPKFFKNIKMEPNINSYSEISNSNYNKIKNLLLDQTVPIDFKSQLIDLLTDHSFKPPIAQIHFIKELFIRIF